MRRYLVRTWGTFRDTTSCVDITTPGNENTSPVGQTGSVRSRFLGRCSAATDASARTFCVAYCSRHTSCARCPHTACADYITKAWEKGTGTFCRAGPSGASHKRCLSPFLSALFFPLPLAEREEYVHQTKTPRPRSPRYFGWQPSSECSFSADSAATDASEPSIFPDYITLLCPCKAVVSPGVARFLGNVVRTRRVRKPGTRSVPATISLLPRNLVTPVFHGLEARATAPCRSSNGGDGRATSIPTESPA